MPAPRTQILLVRIIAGGILVFATLIALGFSYAFRTFDTLIAFGSLMLATIAFLQGYREWAAGFLLTALVFQPLLPIVHLERYQWAILDIALIGYVTLFAYLTTNPYRKGIAFETYVVTLFPKADFALADQTRDSSKSLGRRVESDTNPDLTFRHLKSGEVFAVECKWRGRWEYKMSGHHGLRWDLHQGERYRAYSEKNHVPVLVAFGIGGTPQKPKEVYFVELEKLKYQFLYRELIRSGKTVKAD